MTVELISLDHINEQYFQYVDKRSCKNWLLAKGLSIIKLGKKYFVKEEQFNAVLNRISNSGKTISAVKSKSVKNRLTPYNEIYNDLLRNLNDV